MSSLLPRNPIRWAAIFCVAVTSGFVMWMGYRLNETLSSPGWCATALGAGKASNNTGVPVKGLEACVSLLTIQLKSLSTNSHILLGTIALCLLVLIVIVIAAGKLDIDIPEKLGGGGLHMSRETGATEGAMQTAAAAVKTAGDIAAKEANDVHVPSAPAAPAGPAAGQGGGTGEAGGHSDDSGTARPDPAGG